MLQGLEIICKETEAKQILGTGGNGGEEAGGESF